jgi:hypothetical protein
MRNRYRPPAGGENSLPTLSGMARPESHHAGRWSWPRAFLRNKATKCLVFKTDLGLSEKKGEHANGS